MKLLTVIPSLPVIDERTSTIHLEQRKAKIQYGREFGRNEKNLLTSAVLIQSFEVSVRSSVRKFQANESHFRFDVDSNQLRKVTDFHVRKFITQYICNAEGSRESD